MIVVGPSLRTPLPMDRWSYRGTFVGDTEAFMAAKRSGVGRASSNFFGDQSCGEDGNTDLGGECQPPDHAYFRTAAPLCSMT
jgi:hypothetical protein